MIHPFCEEMIVPRVPMAKMGPNGKLQSVRIEAFPGR